MECYYNLHNVHLSCIVSKHSGVLVCSNPQYKDLVFCNVYHFILAAANNSVPAKLNSYCLLHCGCEAL